MNEYGGGGGSPFGFGIAEKVRRHYSIHQSGGDLRHLNPTFDACIRGLDGERLPVESYLRSSSKPRKRSYKLSSECHRDILSFVFYTPERPHYVLAGVWPAPATYHRPSCERCNARVDRGPCNGCAPFRFLIFQYSSKVLVDRCLSSTRNLAVYKVNIVMSVSQAEVAPISGQGSFCHFLSSSDF